MRGDVHPLVVRLGADAVSDAVRERYGLVASSPPDRTGASIGVPAGRAFAASLGYPSELLDALPAACAESFTGAGDPHPHVELAPGERLCDLGCGAGLDLVRYGRRFPDAGALVGVDFAPAMVGKARANLEAAGVVATIHESSVTRLPFDHAAFDVVTANGIFNLNPDPQSVATEALRVLRPGGRLIFAEIVLVDRTSPPAASLDEWFRCTGGAMLESELHELLRRTGFTTIRTRVLGRNARTGHPASRAGVFSAERAMPA